MKKDADKQTEFMKDELRKVRATSDDRKKWRNIFCIVAFIAIAIIMLAIVFDVLNKGVGFFWLEDQTSDIGDFANNVINHIKGGNL